MSKRYFTLIEVLTVLAIILILAGIAVPVFSRIMRGVQAKQTKLAIERLRLAIEAYKTTYEVYPFTLTAGTDDDLILTDDTGAGSSRDSGTYNDSGAQQTPDLNTFTIDATTYPFTVQTLLECLSGNDTSLNPRGQQFLALDSNGRYTDAWFPWEEAGATANVDPDAAAASEQNPNNRTGFTVVLDLDYNGTIAADNVAGRTTDINGNVAIWSKGRDHEDHYGTDDVNDDNVTSWQ